MPISFVCDANRGKHGLDLGDDAARRVALSVFCLYHRRDHGRGAFLDADGKTDLQNVRRASFDKSGVIFVRVNDSDLIW